ncbi:2-acylglycerol O-acyltransferase 1-like [Thrips palmi]|uniref:Acyltransferase n=1 Tax=Thrips palmi TaxID=161013 RepID=A0A6P8Z8Q8_THRPL|nr:2-acylglycerol O-acyltransferase 1-like [Thrips palmi]
MQQAGEEQVLADVEWSGRKPLTLHVWEALCVASMLFVWACVPLLVVVVGPLLLLCPSTYWLVLPLLAWTFFDRHAGYTGGRRPLGLRGTRFARGILGYYPLRVVRAAGCELDPRRNYILDAHPHGFMQLATLGAVLLSEKVPAAFPGMTFRAAGASYLVHLPIVREVALSLGTISSSERSIRHALQHPGHGLALLVMSGAKEETLRLSDDSYNLYLKRRGFCRVALLEGASLVPVLIFGKIHAYRQPFKNLSSWFHQKTGWRLVLPFGRGIFQPYLGPLPHRVPHTYVIGAPLLVDRTENPTKEQIEDLHERYVEKLKQLYEEYSPKLHSGNVPLNKGSLLLSLCQKHSRVKRHSRKFCQNVRTMPEFLIKIRALLKVVILRTYFVIDCLSSTECQNKFSALRGT